MPLRLVFMGTPQFAVPTLRELVGQGHDVAAVYTQPPRGAGRGMATRKSPVHAAGERSLAMRRGIRFLVTSQREDGGWDEPEYTGTGFPGHFYINYHLYRIVFPIMALARCT